MKISSKGILETLSSSYGIPEWVSFTPFTAMVQAVLVQQSSWNTVVSVIGESGSVLTPAGIQEMGEDELRARIRRCGLEKGKAAAIMALAAWYPAHSHPSEEPSLSLKKQLLSIKGIGEETADFILLYAYSRPRFIIDAYTRRFSGRLGIPLSSDDELRAYYTCGIAEDSVLYGSYHLLLLEHGIRRCGRKPLCSVCPFSASCAFDRSSDAERIGMHEGDNLP